MVKIVTKELSHLGKSSGNYRLGIILVLAAGVCWSTMGLGIRYIETANVWQILFFRSCALALFLFLIITYRSNKKPVQALRKSGVAAIVGGWSLVLAFSGGIFAIQSTTVANAMFLFAAAPFFAALFGWFVLKEKVSKGSWIAIITAMIGISIMVNEGISLGRIIGNLAALGSAIGFALFTVALRWGKVNDMLPTVFLAGLFAIISSVLICTLKGYSLYLPINDILIAILMGFFQVGLGLTLYTMGSKSVPAVQLALLSMTEVLLGPVWVWLILNEHVSFNTLLGGLILMLAIVSNAFFAWKKTSLELNTV